MGISILMISQERSDFIVLRFLNKTLQVRMLGGF